jgi:hypothetical protein
MNGPDNLHEGSYRVEGNYGNYGNSTHTNNDMPAEANRAAEGLAKEGGNSNTSSNHPSLAAGSSALGESGGEHVVGASGGRLTAEEAEEVKRLVARGELSYGEARAAVLAEREPRRRGFSDCSHQKGAHE